MHYLLKIINIFQYHISSKNNRNSSKRYYPHARKICRQNPGITCKYACSNHNVVHSIRKGSVAHATTRTIYLSHI